MADANKVMREQFEYLLEHTRAGNCGCQVCDRYSLVREALLLPFEERTAPFQTLDMRAFFRP